MTRFIGIDPGIHGAIAMLDSSTNTLVVYDTPIYALPGKRAMSQKVRAELNPYEASRILDELKPDYLMMEAVHAMPKDGAISAFQFGKNVGMWEGIVRSKGILMDTIAPRSWQREFNIQTLSTHSVGISKDTKAQSRAVATSLFPSYASLFVRVKDNGRSDAVLLAEYARRTHRIDKVGNLF